MDNKHAIGSDFCRCKAQKVHAHTRAHTHDNYIQQTPAVVEYKHLLLLSNLCLPFVLSYSYIKQTVYQQHLNNDHSAIRIGLS
jgi:meiotically up-regulated gene 157 (Mug157) protein